MIVFPPPSRPEQGSPWLSLYKFCRSSALLRRILLACSFFCVVFCTAELDPNKLQNTMQTRYGADGVAKLNSWQQLVHDYRDRPDTTKIRAANDFINKTTSFVDDIVHWKQSDYWATPLETLGTGAGDCEDYTIAKYATLLEMGVPMERLRLIYVKAQIGGAGSRVFQAHMVLGYYEQPNAIPLILDSLVPEIESADLRTDLHPVFSFNGAGLWVGNQAQPQIDPTARLSRWRDLLERMKQEGF